jgi:RNA recognition motif-containing protein
LKKIFVGSLPENATETSVTELFTEFGKVRSIHLVQDVFTRSCKGFGFIEMEGHEARAAIAGLDGKMYEGKPLKVKFEEVRDKGGKGRRRR